MEHKEDEQPNESVYGRRKRILPFVKNTSRIQGQTHHQFAPILVPASSSESTRGSRYNHGRGRGRGQRKNRGRGGGPPPAPELPQFREVQPWVQLDDLREHNPQPTPPEPSPPPQPSLGMQAGPSSSHPRPEIPKFVVTRQKPDEWAPGPNTLGPQPPILPFQNSKKPRKRFRPGNNGKQKHNDQPKTASINALIAGPSVGRQALQEPGDLLCNNDSCPPAKRPRIEEEEGSPSRAPSSMVTQVKSEIEDDPAIKLLQEKSTTGTKFISYNNHPRCRFNCGERPSQVRKHRKALKRREIQALCDQGKEVLAAFIRDDGIAIDWVVPTKGEVDCPSPNSTSSFVILNTPEPNPPPEEADSPAPPPNRPLPSHLNPLVVSASRSDGRRSSTPTTTEIAYREVPIPSRHLPRDGNTRKLEIWALEQMRLLEAELGSVILPPPELVGVGEYITRQKLPEGVCPHIKLRYKRTVRVQPPAEPSTDSGELDPTAWLLSTLSGIQDETFSLAELMAESPVTLPEYSSTTHPPSVNLPEPTLPLTAHLEAACSPIAPSSPPPVKDEVDELADDPPSLPGSPSLAFATDEDNAPIPTIQLLSGNDAGPQIVTAEGTSRVTSEARNTNLDDLQRLRRDLELSKLEAERRHKELEQRILELSQKHSETPVPGLNVEQLPAFIRIADEGKSNILPLRRGKHDKTRRLLAASDSTLLHVSWLGVMQLVNKGSRRIVATGFGSDAPISISVEDACPLSPSSTALALSGNESQLAIATLGQENFGFLPLRDRPHDAKGVCSIVPIDSQSAITLGHDHRYIHWKFQQDQCSVDPLSLPKLHLCTALAFDPLHNNIVTAGSENNKRSKLTLHNLVDPAHIPNTVELSNHPHHVHIDPDNPFLLILEVPFIYPTLRPLANLARPACSAGRSIPGS
ncbi:unnamed protein product [Rhizoctonia solani]|uniref:Uncharacterized protein n=1 Tax=Rhizoctonia solani TaxID=456999 RepID=A0A8H2XSG2_9AGAM|nr:unnamed protein product [Rhizoctonia solani]